MGEEKDMRKRLVLFAAICCSAVAGLGAVASTAGATGPGSGAGVVRDGGTCFTTDNTSSWLFSCAFEIVFEPNGAITQYITGSVITADSSPLPSRAVTDITTADTGVPCLVLDGEVITTVVAGVVTPSGRVMLTCKS
jgi:hypothetical protein